MGAIPAVPLEAGLAFGLGGAVIAWCLHWIWMERARRPTAALRVRSWRCHICAALYVRSPEERLTICPRCGSYNADEGAQA